MLASFPYEICHSTITTDQENSTAATDSETQLSESSPDSDDGNETQQQNDVPARVTRSVTRRTPTDAEAHSAKKLYDYVL